MRVDIAYSVLANQNYEILPESIAIRESMDDLSDRALKFMQNKRKIEFLDFVNCFNIWLIRWLSPGDLLPQRKS